MPHDKHEQLSVQRLTAQEHLYIGLTLCLALQNIFKEFYGF